jgi:hypothetical protein
MPDPERSDASFLAHIGGSRAPLSGIAATVRHGIER